MTFAARDIFERAGAVLQDTTFVRWTLPELRLWLNDGLREIAIHKPSAVSKNMVLTLVAGTYQTLPAASLGMVRPIRNLASGVASPRVGRGAVTVVAREIMDAQDPNWHDTAFSPATAAVAHVITDPMDVKSFYVWPPNTGTGFLEAIVAVAPTDYAAPASPTVLTSYSAVVDLDDLYQGALLDYILYRAFSKETDLQGSPQRAQAHYNLFAQALGIKTQKQAIANPNTQNAAPTPGAAQIVA